MNPVRVLLVDDHALVRSGLRSLLAGMEGIVVVGEASNGAEALTSMRDLSPDVALMDIVMPRMNGLESLARVTREFPSVKVIVLSMYLNEEYVIEALRNGAMGYMLKDSKPEEVALAIRTVMKGETYYGWQASRHIVQDYLRQASSGPAPAVDHSSPFEQLSPRQREILQLIAEGHTTREIAEMLSLSIKTVETHRSNLMQRLGIHDVAGLVRYAIQVGLINVQEKE